MSQSGIIGQISPAATTLTLLYQVIEPGTTKVGSLLICNTTAGSVTVRVNLAMGGGVPGTAGYVIYNHAIPAYDSVEWSPTSEVTLQSMDSIWVYASDADVAFHVLGTKDNGP